MKGQKLILVTDVLKGKIFQIVEEREKVSLVDLECRTQQRTEMIFWKFFNSFLIMNFEKHSNQDHYYAEQFIKAKAVCFQIMIFIVALEASDGRFSYVLEGIYVLMGM